MILDTKDKSGFVFKEVGPIRCSIEDMVRWAGSCDDFTNFHYEASAAHERGFRAPVINGPWKAMVIRNLLNVWLGSEVKTLKFSIKYLDTDFVGEEMYVNGREIDDHAKEVLCVLALTYLTVPTEANKFTASAVSRLCHACESCSTALNFYFPSFEYRAF